jgi:uncharacterized protein (TIGR00369 family)
LKKKVSSSATTVSAADAFKDHPIANLLKVRMLSVTRKRVTAEMQITESHMNRGGRVGGGIIMTFADLLGARGTVANLPKGARTTTIESKTNFFSAGAGPKLLAVAKPLHIGRTTMVWQTTVTNLDKSRVAMVTQTQIVIPAKKVTSVTAMSHPTRLHPTASPVASETGVRPTRSTYRRSAQPGRTGVPYGI